ncbi:sensor histidine kinase [Paenibacillus agaridevorans]|uniref:sensor histidine kinase n=1 Tax=Paenibacillus agaridevorans TaxID=171404 RepID=UPI001BE49FB3|nr:HAMP domain-containing histidine kinase [Paenibacillus agaridevorans]
MTAVFGKRRKPSLRKSSGKLPFHWRMTLLAAILLSVLVTVSNLTQYFFVERWMVRQEEAKIRQDMRELLNELLAKEIQITPGNETLLRLYLERANVHGGMIRLLDSNGDTAIIAGNTISAERIPLRSLTDLSPGSVLYEDGVLAMRSPITIFNFQGTIEMVRSMEELERLIARFFRIMIICCGAALLLSIAGGRLLAVGLIRPLRAMNATMKKVRQNGLQERMPVTGAKDEITALQTMFNGMMDEVEASFGRQRRFVEDASHELRTPIAIMDGHLRMLSRWGKHDPDVTENSLRIATEELERLKGLVDNLLLLSRAERTEELEPRGICEQPLTVLKDAADKQMMMTPEYVVNVEAGMLEEVSIAIGEHELAQLLRILLDNAVKYSGEGRVIAIIAELDVDQVRLSVEDRGVGISEEDIPHVWDRFYRADKARSGGQGGYGLGLPIAKSLVRRHGGDIVLTSELGVGTKVTVSLPLA